MSRVKELEKEIEKLAPDELAQIGDWILERDWEAWDRQIEKDSGDGRLGRLLKKSLADHQAGKSKEV